MKLTPVNRHELDYYLKLLNEVALEISKQQRVLERLASRYPEAKLLQSIPGIAAYSALLIIAEIGDIGRFPTPEKLASYTGLISSTYKSGNGGYQGRITKQGSSWLRWILVDAALRAVRKPNCLQQFYKRLVYKKGHKNAIVATARKLITIIWHVLAKKASVCARMMGLNAPRYAP